MLALCGRNVCMIFCVHLLLVVEEEGYLIEGDRCTATSVCLHVNRADLFVTVHL